MWNFLPFIYLLLFFKAQCDSTALSKIFAEHLMVWLREKLDMPTGEQGLTHFPAFGHFRNCQRI